MKILTKHSYSLTTTKCNNVCDIKDSLCFVTIDFEEEMRKAAKSSALKKSLKLDNGNIIEPKVVEEESQNVRGGSSAASSLVGLPKQSAYVPAEQWSNASLSSTPFSTLHISANKSVNMKEDEKPREIPIENGVIV
eukprot:15366027-Ditylum_brightwellii.AAC.1